MPHLSQERVAGPELDAMKHARDSLGEEDDADADHDLVEPQPHTQKDDDKRYRHPREHAAKQSNPRRMSVDSPRVSGEGPDEHVALLPDTELTGLLP